MLCMPNGDELEWIARRLSAKPIDVQERARSAGPAMGDDGRVAIDLVQICAGEKPMTQYRAEGMRFGGIGGNRTFPDQLSDHLLVALSGVLSIGHERVSRAATL